MVEARCILRVTDWLSRDWLLVVLLALLLSGCSGAGAPPPGVTPAVFAVVLAVWKLRGLGKDRLLLKSGDDFKGDLTDLGKHVQFFLRWRAEAHLASDSNRDKATQAVAVEYGVVRDFTSTVIGIDPDTSSASAFITGTDKTPGHLDLNDVLRVRTNSPAIDGSNRRTKQLHRWERAMAIVWRAAALEADLWNPAFSEAALREVLDRRLRLVERMIYQVSASVAGELKPDENKPTGPWFDGVRVRMFEYPFLHPGSQYRSQIGEANIGPQKMWRIDHDGDPTYNLGNGTRLRIAASSAFDSPSGVFPANYPLDLLPTSNADQALDDLFTPSEDWWDRSWIYCDQVLAALHIEALRFGKSRRARLGSEPMFNFNAAVSAHPRQWISLRPTLPGMPGDWRLMADDRGKPSSEPRLFANGPVPHVQLGDHVVFWNSIMYGLLSDGAWSLENAIVVGLTSDWTKNDIGNDITLMGHGTPAQDAGIFRLDLADLLNAVLIRARESTKATTADSLAWVRDGAPLVRWAPYGEAWTDERGNPQVPWWLRLPFDPIPGWEGRAIGRAATLRTAADAIEYEPGMTHAPPAAGGGAAGAAYFPLWWPAPEGKWKGYLARRKKGQNPTNFELAPVRLDKNNIPGLTVYWQFVDGADQVPYVFAIRPFVSHTHA